MAEETELPEAGAAPPQRRRSSFWLVHDWLWFLSVVSAFLLAGAFFLFLVWADRQPPVGALARELDRLLDPSVETSQAAARPAGE